MDQDGCYVPLPGRDDNVVGDEQLTKLPLGFRFHPTDEELVTYYLSRKVANHRFSAGVIGEVDLNQCEPWDLPWRGASATGQKEWYFFCVRDRKYPAGLRANRATGSGYWKATGKDREVRRGKSLVGRKKTLVFYEGRAPHGEKTSWVMHEYRLDGTFSLHNKAAAKNEWVICRVFQRGSRSTAAAQGGGGGEIKVSAAGDLLQARTGSSAACYGDGAGVRTSVSNTSSADLLPPLMELPFGGTGGRTVGATTAAPGANHVTCFSNVAGAAGHNSHEGPVLVDYGSSSRPFLIPTTSSGVSSSVLLPLGKLSGEVGLVNLVRSHGYAVQEGIGSKEQMGAARSSTSPETDMHRPGINSALLPVSSHEVFSRQKVPSDPAGFTIPNADHYIWNYKLSDDRARRSK